MGRLMLLLLFLSGAYVMIRVVIPLFALLVEWTQIINELEEHWE